MDLNALISGVLGSPTQTGSGILSGLASPATNLGLSLLANSGPTRLPTTFGQALGQSAIQAQDAQSQAVARRAQLAQSLLGLQMAQGRMSAFQNAMGGAPQQGGPPVGQAPMGAPGAAQGAAGASPSAATPSPQVQAANTNSPLAKWLNPPSQSDIASTQVGPFANASAYPALAFYSGQDPVKAAQEVHAQQLQQMQQRYAPQIAKLAGVVQSDDPSRDVKADPTLTALWQQYATQRGLDPSLTGKDFTDANLRQVFGGAANQFRAALSEPGVAPPVAQQTIKGPLNSLYTYDPVSGKYTQVRGEESLHQVDLGGGKHPLLPTSEAAGKQGFNPTLFGVANLSTDAKDLAYQYWKVHGTLPVSFSRSPAASAEILNDFAQRAKADGDSAAAIAAQQASYKSATSALTQNQKLLTASNGYYGTLERNLDNLETAYKKAGSLGSPLLNRALRAWQQHGSGDPDTAAMVTFLNAAQGEYAKLKSGSLGNAPASDAAMADAREVINKAMTQGGIEAVRQAMLTEGGNRISSIQAENDRLTNLMGGSRPNSKPLPGAAKLQAYATAHFGGDVGKATAFLKSQGYQ